MATLYNSKRKSYTTLNNGGSLSAGATSVTVTSAASLPTAPFLMYIDPGLASEELVAVTGVSSNTLTIVRGLDGTTGQTHADGALVKNLTTSLAWQDLLTIFGAHAHTGTDSSVVLPNYYPYKNALPNGGLGVWQRGTTFNGITSGTRFADNWAYFNATTTGACNIAQLATVSGGGVPLGVNAPSTAYFINGQLTVADTSISAGEYMILRTAIEGFDYNALRNGFTLSFWTNHTLTGTYCVAFGNGGQDRSYVAEYTQNVSGTWEYKTITVSSTITAGTWNYTNGIGLYIFFALAAGSTYQTTPGAWQTGNFFATSNQVNFASSTTSRFFNFSHINLIPGLVAQPIQLVPYAQELTRCQRYYQRLFEPGTAHFGTGMAYGTTTAIFSKDFYIPMRASPTITVTNPTTAVLTNSTYSGLAVASLTADYINPYNTRFTATSATGLVAGNATTLSQVGGTCLIEAGSEL